MEDHYPTKHTEDEALHEPLNTLIVLLLTSMACTGIQLRTLRELPRLLSGKREGYIAELQRVITDARNLSEALRQQEME